MILTVTINPIIERRYYYSKLNFSTINREGKLILKAGGKGINVNRQLNNLGVKNTALLFAGGVNGKILREVLRSEKINFSYINTKDNTREAAIIINQSDEKIYSFFSSDSLITAIEAKEFIVILEKAIAACEIVVFSGSSPCEATDSIFVEGIKIANRLDKISLCDTYGRHLQNCFDSSPTIVHNNVDEIRSSLYVNMENENNQLNFLNFLYNNGIKQSYITDSGKTFYTSNFDFHYRVTPPEIRTVDSTGSGDAFVAGIVYGWHKKLNYEQQLGFATALGVINAKSAEVCNVGMGDVESLVEKISIEPIGKRLKELNDSPE